MKHKITEKQSREIISKNPQAIRLIEFAEKRGWDIYYGNTDKNNPWVNEYIESESCINDIDVVCVGKGKRSTDDIFNIFVYEKDDKSGLPDGDLSKQLEIDSLELDKWVVDDLIAEHSTHAIINGKKYDIWDCQDTDEIEIGRLKDGYDEDDWEELSVSFDEVEEFI